MVRVTCVLTAQCRLIAILFACSGTEPPLKRCSSLAASKCKCSTSTLAMSVTVGTPSCFLTSSPLPIFSVRLARNASLLEASCATRRLQQVQCALCINCACKSLNIQSCTCTCMSTRACFVSGISKHWANGCLGSQRIWTWFCDLLL